MREKLYSKEELDNSIGNVLSYFDNPDVDWHSRSEAEIYAIIDLRIITREMRDNADLNDAARDLLRENEAACGSLDNIIRNLENVETDDDAGWCRMDADQIADELRMIRLLLENVARKAKGETV